MVLYGAKIFLLVAIFQMIPWDKSQVLAITSSPSSQSTSIHNSSNYGRHFVLGFTEQFRQNGYIQVSIVAKFDTIVTVATLTSSSRQPIVLNVKAGNIMQYKLLPISLRMQGINIERKGIEINSTEDVTLFCLNHGVGTSDGYLALPTNALGTVYVVASYQPSAYTAHFGIISVNNETSIRIKLNTIGNITYRGTSYSKGSSFSITLDKLETFHISHLYDLSGTIITANKPISVISGNRCANVGGVGYCDHLAAFLLPVKNWGNEFVVATTGSMDKRVGPDIFRVFAYKNNTIVYKADRESVLLSGEFTEIDVTDGDLASSVHCSKPCQVVQYVKSRYRTDIGYYADPSMIVLPSVKQFLSYYHVALFTKSAFIRHYITLLIKNCYNNGLIMNGTAMNGLHWETINGTDYTWTVVNVSGFDSVTISHTSPEKSFGLLVFGEGDHVSYGYPGGFALIDTNKYNEVAVPSTAMPVSLID